MTFTSDERREVAARLRQASHTDANLDVTIAIAILDTIGEVQRPIAAVLADLIDPTCERELAEQQDSLTVGMQPMTEENMAEGGWVRGPLDADGKMWRSGDMSDSNWGVIEGIAYVDGRWLVSGHDMCAPWIPADSIRHYHAPTVEDVLREFSDKVCNSGHQWGLDADTTIAEYAAKLRLAEGVDE